jgi:hypothetical protein
LSANQIYRYQSVYWFSPVTIFGYVLTATWDLLASRAKLRCWICEVFWRPFWKWRPVEICQCQESIREIIIYLHMKWHWNWIMLNNSTLFNIKGSFWFIFWTCCQWPVWETWDFIIPIFPSFLYHCK